MVFVCPQLIGESLEAMTKFSSMDATNVCGILGFNSIYQKPVSFLPPSSVCFSLLV